MKLFFIKIKTYLSYFLLLVVAILSGVLFYKNSSIEKLKEDIKKKVKKINQQKEELKQERKKQEFKTLDIAENVEVLKDFRGINTEAEKEINDNEKNINQPTDDDTFNFTV